MLFKFIVMTFLVVIIIILENSKNVGLGESMTQICSKIVCSITIKNQCSIDSSLIVQTYTL